MARRVYCCVLLTTGPDGNDDSRLLSSAVVNRCNLIPSLICRPPLVFPHFHQVFVKTTRSLFFPHFFLHYAAVMLSELVFLDFQCVARNHQTSSLSPLAVCETPLSVEPKGNSEADCVFSSKYYSKKKKSRKNTEKKE